MHEPATPVPAHRLTLMNVHAHPDDETIGTGGVMAKAVADGHRVVLVTCTRGEMGDIVVPEMDTPDNHRRLAELRAAELEAALGELGVTEWENLGYRDSDMMGRPGNLDPRCFWQADLDEAIGRLVWLMRRYRPDVVTTYNDFGGYGHPDHIRTHLVGVGAYERAGDPRWYTKQLSADHGGDGPADRQQQTIASRQSRHGGQPARRGAVPRVGSRDRVGRAQLGIPRADAQRAVPAVLGRRDPHPTERSTRSRAPGRRLSRDIRCAWQEH